MRRCRRCFYYGLPYIPFYDSGITDTEVYRLGEFEKDQEEDPAPVKKVQPNNEIWYTTTEKIVISDTTSEQWSMEDYGAMFVSNTYEGEHGILKFDNDIQYIKVNYWEFDNQYGLETISIPASVTAIDGNGGFHRCPIKSITFLSQTPPTVREEFIDAVYDDLIIYVPADSVEAYKTAENWTMYADRIRPIVED